MKSNFILYVTILTSILVLSCKEKPVPPVVSTTTATAITTTTAVSGGNVTDDGGSSIISRGICWNTSDNPVITNNKTSESAGSGSFTSNLAQLIPSTTYFVRAYATNSAGTSYGSSVSFKTLGDKPASTSTNATSILTTSATLNGTVNPNSLATTVTFEYGLTTSYGGTASAAQSPLSADAIGNVTIALTGLAPGTTYHFRVKAENSLGITFSSDMTFTTLGLVPTVLVQAATNLKTKTVTLNGSVNPNYLSSTINIEWGTTTAYGNLITPSQSPLTGSTAIIVTTELSGLTAGESYHFRIKSTNELGTSYSDDMTFTTLDIEWITSTSFPGVARCLPLSFTYNGKGFYGLGRNSINPAVENLKDFWTFDPVSSSWTRLNDCPFTFINGLSAKCLVGSVLYVFKEYSLYSYNFINDSWQFVCNSSNSLFSMSCFSIDNKVFFFNKSNSELYEFLPQSNTFNKKAAIIDGYLNWGLAETFVINNEAFVVHKNNTIIEIFHYLPQSDRWEKKIEKVFSNLAFTNASFIIANNSKAFIGQSTSFSLSGTDDNAIVTPDMPSSNVWKYDYLKNEFKQAVSISGEVRAQSGSFSFDTFGYVIGGVTIDSNTQMFKYLNDILELLL
jgi:hypothetical protein